VPIPVGAGPPHSDPRRRIPPLPHRFGRPPHHRRPVVLDHARRDPRARFYQEPIL